MELINQKVAAYATRFTSLPDEILQENEVYTAATHPLAHMHSGLLQGKLLEFISHMIKPVKILEIGTFTGFSALSLIKGLQPGGRLHTIELRQEDASTAMNFFRKANALQSIQLHVGNAHDIIPTLSETWDLVFIDADKVSYIDYYELTLPMLRPGGWIVADNVLFHGQVLDEEIKGKNAIAIQAFNEHVLADKRVEQLLLTVRDGLLIIRKL